MNRAERRRLVAAFARQRVKDALRQIGHIDNHKKKGFKKFVRTYVKKWANEDLKLHPDKVRDNITACLQNDALTQKKSTP